jgi:hypothetical protein
VLNAVFAWSSSFTGTCWNPLAQSIVEKYLEFSNASRISEITGIGNESPTVTSLRFLKYTILHFFLPEASAFFGITNIGDVQGLVLG